MQSIRKVLATLASAAIAGCGTAQMPGFLTASTLRFASASVAQSLVQKYGRGLGEITKGTTPLVNDLDQASPPGFNVQDTAALPPKVDLRNLMSPMADQGELGSCTAFAAVKGIGEFLELQKIRAQGGDATKDFVPLSPGYLYFQEREMTGETHQDSGAQVFLAMKMLSEGVPPEADYPYPTKQQQSDPWFMQYWLPATPSDPVNFAAEQFAGGRLESVDKLSQLKAELAAGNPVAFGFLIFDQWYETAATHMQVPNIDNEQIVGGHAVVAVGYDDDTQEVLFRNSWGTQYGEKGYFYMPYKYFDAQLGLASDGWVLMR